MAGAPERPPLTRTARFAWGAVALLLVGVIALVVYALTDTPVAVQADPRSPTGKDVLHALATVPASTFDTVGVSAPGTGLVPPSVVRPPGPKASGKPQVFFAGAEFCPYCAAERWPLVVALSRFGTFTALDDVQSSTTAVFPGLQTFSFVNARYTSRYVTFTGVEEYSTVPNRRGVYTVLTVPSAGQQALLARFRPPGQPAPGTYPLVDVDNLVVASSAGFSPAILVDLSQATVVGNLATATTPEAKAIVASANYLSAGICDATGQQPASVCDSKGVRAADQALGLG